MCFTIDQLDRACGILLLTESNRFIYFCKFCEGEFESGVELEVHIRFEHTDGEEKPLEGVFVADSIDVSCPADIFGQPANEIQSDSMTFDGNYVQSDVKVEPADLASIEITRKSKRVRTKHTNRVESKLRTVNRDKRSSETLLHRSVDADPTIDTAKIPIKIEEISNELKNESASMDEPLQGSCSDKSDSQDDTIEDNLYESKRHRQSSLKKLKGKSKRSHGKPQKGIFHCDMCPEVTCGTLETLKAHMKRHIMNKIRQPCPLCPIRPYNMEKHMRIAHIEAKPYKCDLCDATFRHNNALVFSSNLNYFMSKLFRNFNTCLFLTHLGNSQANTYWGTALHL